MKALTLSCLMFWAMVSTAYAQAVSQDEANAANNPLAATGNVSLQDFYVPSVKGLPERDANQLLLRGTLPHDLFGAPQIMRFTAPIVTAPSLPTGDETGLGDLSMFDLFLFKGGPGVELGIGPLLVMPTASDDALGQGKWQAGLSGVVVAPQSWGLLAALVTYQQSFAGDDDRSEVRQLAVQPIVTYNLSGGFYLRSSGSASFEFEQGNHFIPVGLGAGKVWSVAPGTRLNTFIEPQYTVWQEGEGTPKWQVLAGISLQFPIGSR
jgi:hypothetical protein